MSKKAPATLEDFRAFCVMIDAHKMLYLIVFAARPVDWIFSSRVLYDQA